MTKRRALSLLMSTALIAGCSTVIADKPVNKKAQTVVQETNKEVSEERVTALQAMHNMSQYLRSLKKYTVNASVSFDEVLSDGQKVLLSKSVEIRAEMPYKLWAKSANHYSQREFFFNGDTFTLYTPNLGYYASFNMSTTGKLATIGQTIRKAKQEYDVEIPIADLFLWGTKADSSADVNEAIIVGIDQVNGVDCNHFAFRENDIDWQIFIQREGAPLPLKLVITEKNIAEQPQHITVLKWNTAPDLSSQNYTFTPKASDQKIKFGKVRNDN